MRYDIQYSPAYALAIITLDPGETLQTESGAMVSMSANLQLEAALKGGILGGLKRSVLGGESFFLNFVTAPQAGEITIAPTLPGDIVALEMTSQTLYVQSGSYLASTTGIDIDTKFAGGRGFFSAEGLFLLRCTGRGLIFLSSYGAIRQLTLPPGGKYLVDTGHMVAFDESIQWSVRKAGESWKTAIFSGEGLVVDLTGPGRFFLQTRSPGGLVQWLTPRLPRRE